MVCCVVTAFLLAILHRLMPWRRVSDDGGFAPAATRLSPDVDQSPAAPAMPERWLTPGAAAGAWILRFAGLSAAIWLAGGAALVLLGIAHTEAPAWAWVLRSLIVGAAAVTALAYASRLHRGAPDPSSRIQILGFAALGSGAMSMFLMEVDMHLLGLYDIGDESLHVTLHTTAVLAMLAGGAITAAAQRSATPAPAMAGSAR